MCPLSEPSRSKSTRNSARWMIKVIALVMAVAFTVSIPARAAEGRKVIARVKPVYPDAAKRMKVTGTVLLNVTVEPSGRVKAAEPVMGESLLLAPAKTAVMQWRYEPAHFETVEEVEIALP